MIRRPPRSTLFPSRRSSDLVLAFSVGGCGRAAVDDEGGSDEQITVRMLKDPLEDRKSTCLNSSHSQISYAVFCLKKKKKKKKKKNKKTKTKRDKQIQQDNNK